MDTPVWEDREVKFDLPNVQNSLRSGEKTLNIIDHVEDSKGNPDDSGKIIVTNLRIIWCSLVHRKFNVSIGYSRIVTITERTVYAKRQKTRPALHTVVAGINMRFEFLFTDMSMDSSNVSPFASIFDVYRLYQGSYLYREVKLRGAITQGNQLIILPQEQVYSTFQGVWNLSSDQGNLGSFIITNIRMVWFADVNESFNISLPYMQMASIKIRDSKYGPALVIHTLPTGGGYVLGFRIDPSDRLVSIYQELKSLFAVYGETPNFGVFYKANKNLKSASDVQQDETKEDAKQSSELDVNLKLSRYLAEGSTLASKQRPPFYCKELGFAMEKIRDGYKLSDLWNIRAINPENSTT